jgi:hypothetical protein
MVMKELMKIVWGMENEVEWEEQWKEHTVMYWRPKQVPIVQTITAEKVEVKAVE